MVSTRSSAIRRAMLSGLHPGGDLLEPRVRVDQDVTDHYRTSRSSGWRETSTSCDCAAARSTARSSSSARSCGRRDLHEHHVERLSGGLAHHARVQVVDVHARVRERARDRGQDPRMVGAVDRDDPARGRCRSLRVGHLAQRQRLHAERVAGLAQLGGEGLGVELRGAGDQQHHREVPAQDRHLGVGHVDPVGDQALGDRRDDAGPVEPDAGDGEGPHPASIRPLDVRVRPASGAAFTLVGVNRIVLIPSTDLRRPSHRVRRGPSTAERLPSGCAASRRKLAALPAAGLSWWAMRPQVRFPGESPEQRRARALRERVHDLRDARQRILAAADAERRRIERDLHDGAQQRMVAVAVRSASPRRASPATRMAPPSSSRRRARRRSSRSRSCASWRAASTPRSSATVGSVLRSRRSPRGLRCRSR